MCRNRSDRCDELKRLESAYLTLQGQVEDVERSNEKLDRKKIQSLSRYFIKLKEISNIL